MIFGIISLILTGLSWSLVGVVMGGAPKRNINTSIIQLFGGLVCIIVSLCVLLSSDLLASASSDAIMKTGICAILSGFLNFIMLELMSVAMQSGPNGIVWSIVQSGIIGPFSMGLICFGVPATPIRLLGMGMIIVALILFGLYQDNGNQKSSRKWLLFAFIAFFFCATQQSVNNIPSYYEDMSKVPGVFRSMMNSIGICICSFAAAFVRRQPIFKLIAEAAKNRHFWLYIFMLQSCGLITGYFLFYQGMDALAKVDMGAVSYPITVGSCIIGFFLYSLFGLKEHAHPMQYLALVLCLAGIAEICIKDDSETKDNTPSQSTQEIVISTESTISE